MAALQQILMMLSGGSGEYAGWTPADGSTPYVWYMGDDPSNTDDGTFYTRLEDLSGNGRHAESANINNVRILANAIGTRTGLNCNTGGSMSSPHHINLPGATGMLNGAAGFAAAFVLYRADWGSGGHTLFFAETSSRNTARAFLTVEETTDDTPRFVSRRANSDGASYKESSTTISNAGYAILTMCYDVANRILRLRVDGNETTQTSYGTSGSTFDASNSYDGPWLLGTNPPSGTAYECYKGNLGEIVLYNQVVSQAELEKLEGYLAHTWAVTSVLPGGHPYKSTPPSV